MASTFQGGRTTLQVRKSTREERDMGNLDYAISKKIDQTWTAGTGKDQQQIVFDDTISLAGGASLILDLDTTAKANGAEFANNGRGDCKFTKIKEVTINVTTTTATASLAVGGGDTPIVAFTTARTIGPGGLLHISEPSLAGLAVTAATADLLKIENTSSPSASITFDLIISGIGTEV